jgi:hypothetical protein
MAPHKFKSTTDRNVNDFKATFEQWLNVQEWGTRERATSPAGSCILELRSRIEQLEAQANHVGDINKMVPPTVATDEELDDTWHKTTGGTFLARRRAIYNLGIEHGRRPKPPSLKEQALAELEGLRNDAYSMGMGFDAPAIRLALKALPND